MKQTTKTKTREFEPVAATIRKALAVAARYTLVISPDDDGGYIGYARELPGVIAGGETTETCARSLTFALETAISAMIESGRRPPQPFGSERRSEQVNLRLTPSEKDLLEEESNRRGFRGVADFIRTEIIEALNVSRA